MLDKLNEVLAEAKANQPTDRNNPKSRYYAVLITETEKLIALYQAWS